MIARNYKYVAFAFLLLLLSGCIGTKHLKENEKLLYRQGIQAPKQIDTEKLHELFTRKANRKILGLPISPLVSVYYFGLKRYDQEKYIRKKEAVIKKFDDKIANATSQKKIDAYQFRKQKKVDRLDKVIDQGNLWMQWGEPLSIFDSTQVKLTTDRIHDYLFSKGYFNNVVTSKIVALNKLVRVSYKVAPGLPYFIDSIFFQIKDTAVFRFVQKYNDASYIKKGDQYDQDKFTSERERIDYMLKDNGFFDFSRQYIDFEVDTTMLGMRRVAVLMIIRDPASRGYHKQFRIDSVTFTTDATAKSHRERLSRSYRNIRYRFHHDDYNLKILSQRVFIVPGELYSRSNTINTQRQLANLDAFKFVNISYDSSGGKFTAGIFTSPLDRYQWSNEAGVNVTQGFPGPFYNISFKKRNVFRGLESFDLNGRFGFEGVASATSDQNVYKSTSAGINASITLPQLLFPFRDATRYKLGKLNPKTKILTGYAYTDRPEYRRANISLSGTYNLESKRNKTTQYSLTFANLSIINTERISTEFQKILNTQDSLGNHSLVNSFKRSFVNSIIFGITWNPNNYGNLERSSTFIRAQVESGGTIWNFIDPKIITDAGLQYFKYLRLTLDARRNTVLKKNTVLAYRFNGGVAYSYGSNNSLPYEKFFFAGGSNGIRAWRPRRLGPGSFKPNLSTNPAGDGLYSYSIEQPADILLEGSIEFRQKLFGFIDGAIFLDAGNVWTFQPRKKIVEQQEVENGNSQFRIDSFYKEIGVGTGFGLRFDFTFLIVRLDVGIKVYDPARDEDDRFVLNKARFFKPYASKDANGNYFNFREPVIYNFGIGYPF